MPLVNLKDMLRHARANRYAVGAYEPSTAILSPAYARWLTWRMPSVCQLKVGFRPHAIDQIKGDCERD